MKSLLATLGVVLTVWSGNGQQATPRLLGVRLPDWSVTMPTVSKPVLPPISDAIAPEVHGTLEAEVVVGTGGTVMWIRMLRTTQWPAAMLEPAATAIRQWKFKPAVEKWRAVPVRAIALVRMTAEPPSGDHPGRVTAELKPIPERAESVQSKIPLPDALPQDAKGMQAPMLRLSVEPNYTSDAMRAIIQGDVELDVVIDTDGTVDSVRVVRSLDSKHGLDRQAVEAASHWVFEPARQSGQPVAVHATVILTFRLH
jgi:TonB family protein